MKKSNKYVLLSLLFGAIGLTLLGLYNEMPILIVACVCIVMQISFMIISIRYSIEEAVDEVMKEREFHRKYIKV